jgi:hypothetical protein
MADQTPKLGQPVVSYLAVEARKISACQEKISAYQGIRD